jgi:hypothetical protein
VGAHEPQSYDGKDYFVSFTDDHSRWTYLVPMARKGNAFDRYKQYKAWVKTQHGARLKHLQTDHRGEYLSDDFTVHLKSKGTVWSLKVHDTPEENGVSECLNCMLLEHVHAMHLTAGLPKFLWTESIQHTVWLKNQTSMCVLDGKTPYELMHREKLNLTDLPEFVDNCMRYSLMTFSYMAIRPYDLSSLSWACFLCFLLEAFGQSMGPLGP